MRIHRRKNIIEKLRAGSSLLLSQYRCIGALALGGILVGGGALFFLHSIQGGNGKSLTVYAQEIVEKCSEARNTQPCYDEEIPRLMEVLSMEEAFEVTKLVQAEDSSYWYCHVLSHNLSEREVRKDPSEWKSVLARCPNDMCSYGCAHGVFQEEFRASSLTPQQIEEVVPVLQGVCSERARIEQGAPLDEFSCYHGLGHVTMYLTDADVMESARLCDRIVGDSAGFGQTCYEGIFMQIFQPKEQEDIALVENLAPQSQEEAVQFCGQFGGELGLACEREKWVLFSDEVQTGNGILSFCSYAQEDGEYNRCLNKLFFSMVSIWKLDIPRLENLCKSLDGFAEEKCFSDVAIRMITIDKSLTEEAVEFCSRATHTQCYQNLAAMSSYFFASQSEERKHFCEAFPRSYQSSCRATGAE